MSYIRTLPIQWITIYRSLGVLRKQNLQLQDRYSNNQGYLSIILMIIPCTTSEQKRLCNYCHGIELGTTPVIRIQNTTTQLSLVVMGMYGVLWRPLDFQCHRYTILMEPLRILVRSLLAI